MDNNEYKFAIPSIANPLLSNFWWVFIMGNIWRTVIAILLKWNSTKKYLTDSKYDYDSDKAPFGNQLSE